MGTVGVSLALSSLTWSHSNYEIIRVLETGLLVVNRTLSILKARLNCHLGLIRSVRPIQSRPQSHLYFAIRVRTIIIKKCQNLKLTGALLKLRAQAGLIRERG